MKFIALKTENGRITGKTAFYCKTLDVSRQGFYNYLKYKDKPWKKEEENLEAEVPEEQTVYRIMEKLGISHRPRKLKGLTKVDKEAQKSDDLLKRNFTADESDKKGVTDITELKASNGKLYLSVIFDCFDLLSCRLAMGTNLCTETIDNALKFTLNSQEQSFIQIVGVSIQVTNIGVK